MARPGQILGRGCGVNDGPNRPRPLLGTDARVTRLVVHRDRVRGLVRGRIPIHHRGKMKPGSDFRQNRHAYKTASVRDHELDHFGRDLVGGRDKIPLVFAVLVVNDDDDPPFPQCLECVVNLREFIVHGRFLTSKRRIASKVIVPNRSTRGAVRHEVGDCSGLLVDHSDGGYSAPSREVRVRGR